ncbi:hypothetical protein [Parapedobacter tibetensis]|uniref:hypothetical protein n=1 Tax=Parapedobacter tibetensis TaxID=2972951 RepID=UPI00214DEA92|nr:hypothetical protein [Parapedobacter tibetensis]
MKILTFLLALAFASALWVHNKNSKGDMDQSVNAILGDVSFEDRYAKGPTAETDEDLRIGTHLAYVENILWDADVSTLPSELREKRQLMLGLLHTYRTTGVFPRNYDYVNERKPCFIDKDGQICAVGYLIEQTAGRGVAEAINKKYKYEKILDMQDPAVDNWIASSGLTKMECAMIQPSYGGVTIVYDDKNHVSKGYGMSSALLSGANLSFTTINAIQIGRGTDNRVVPWIGLASGAAQITLGIAEYPEEEMNIYDEPYMNVGQRNVSLLNIGLGTATMILSSWNLIANKPRKERAVRWGFQRISIPNGHDGLGFNVVKRF